MPWEPRAVGKTAACRCGRRFKVLDVAEEDEEQSFIQCGGYQSYRAAGFPSLIPNSVGPGQLVRLIWWFSQRTPIEQASVYSGCRKKTTSKVFFQIRSKINEEMFKICTDENLGGPGKVVCVDETFLTKKKKSKARMGRVTAPNQTIIFGGTELDLETRVATGRSFLLVIPNRKRITLEPIIRKRILPGSTIWTDLHKSYHWLGKPNSGYSWDSVIHSKGKLSKGPEHISTNSVEGLFSRLKKHLRTSRVTYVSQKHYGIYLGEFLWRDRALKASILGTDQWRHYAFWALCRLLGTSADGADGLWTCPEAVAEEFCDLEKNVAPHLPPLPAPKKLWKERVGVRFAHLAAAVGPIDLDGSFSESLPAEVRGGAATPIAGAPQSPKASPGTPKIDQDPAEQFSGEDSVPFCPGVHRLSEVAAGDRVVSGRSFQVKYGGGSRPGTWRRIFVISRCRDLLTCRTDEGRIRTYKASRILECSEARHQVPTQEKAEDEVPGKVAVPGNSEYDLFGTPLTSQENGPGEGSSSFAPAPGPVELLLDVETRVCSNGHNLLKVKVCRTDVHQDSEAWHVFVQVTSCDLCARPIKLGGIVWRCIPCEWDAYNF